MYDFSKPYRTETWSNALKGHKLKTPVTIPSVNRPDAPILRPGGFLDKTPEFDKNDVFIFIRDTKEQYDLYKHLERKYTLVPLPHHVREIGLTREAILQWGIKNGYNNLFMFDDRLTQLIVLAPKLTRNAKLCMAQYSDTSNYLALLLWEHFHKIYPTTVSGIVGWGHCWYPENINAEFKVNNPASAYCYINIDLDDCKKFDLHYYDTLKYGTEDSHFLYDVLIRGLPSRVFSDIAFKEVHPEDLHLKNINSGGSSNISGYQGMTRKDRLLQMKKLFVTQTLGLDWDNLDHPGLKIQKHKTEGIMVRFYFSKYWAKYYEEHCAKPAKPNQTPQLAETKPVQVTSDTDLYHIPGDTGKPWRFKKMVEYIGNFPDEIGPIVNSYFDANNFSSDERLWWVFLYSTCYCMGSGLVMAKQLDYKTITPADVEGYWKANKSKLIFQTDRRYIKHMNQFTEMVNEFLTRTNRHLYDYISQFVTDDPEQTYKNLYKEISGWKYYGRFGIILFIFNLCKVFPHIKVESLEYDWKTGSTTTSAIFNARYEDERANVFDAGKISLSADDIKMLDATLKIVTDELQKSFPQKKWNIIYVSSDLCSYRKLFKGVRYQGYYVDRQMEEILTLQKNYPEYKDLWQFIWDARSEYLDHHLLGELNGWSGIRKERCKLFLEKGYVGSDPKVV